MGDILKGKLKFVSKKERQLLRAKDQENKVESSKVDQVKCQDAREEKVDDVKKKVSDEGDFAPIMDKKEIEQIKEAYLGKKKSLISSDGTWKEKEKVSGPKFRFAWDESEDTSKDSLTNLLVANGNNNLRDHEKVDDVDIYSVRKKRRKIDETNNKTWREKLLEEMTDRDWRILREDFEIHVNINNKLHLDITPIRFWSDLQSKVSPELMSEIIGLRYVSPTPVQMQCIPIGLQTVDIIGVAETGSGKTISFLVPLFNYLEEQSSSKFRKLAEDGPLSIILAPTRELAQQITAEAMKLHSRRKWRFECIVGGTDIESQGIRLRAGCEVIIGTPGRIIDCIESRYIVLNQCDYVVLDEADTMIDMGFEPQVEFILNASKSTSKRHMIMFSATMPKAVEALAKKYMTEPVIVRIGDLDASRNQRIEQRIIVCTEQQKIPKLKDVIHKTDPPILVFVSTRSQCKTVAKILSDAGYRVAELHAGKSQDQREESLKQFKDQQVDVLVATDVASRGLDIRNIKHVINYDMATTIERYTHRIGRTGRAGQSGLATSFITDRDEAIYKDLCSYLIGTNSRIPPELENHPVIKDDDNLNFKPI